MIVVRKAKLEDISLIMKFEKELLSYATNIINEYNPQQLIDIRLREDFEDILFKYIRGRIYSKNDAVFIAEFKDEAVGHMIASIKKNFPIFNMKYYGRINTVFIKEEFRGKGISSELKKEAFKWFKTKSINRISLNVDPNNKRAIDVYKNWGLKLSLLEMRILIF